ncbi:MAG: TDT family transporter [Lachnospiraceae bacterium]|nr:TDT family transporter [Lachnospiraceae bacterium]
MERLSKLPVPAIATFLALLTMGNVYGGLGFVWLRYLIMGLGTIFVLCYLSKVVMFFSVCAKEYGQTIPMSLYAAMTMCLMILGSFYYEIGLGFGKIIWLIAVIVHAVHILVFTWQNIIAKRNIMTTMPSWFVTYNGIMVSCVTGGAMDAKPLLQVITIYGIIIYLLLVPVMIWRLIKVDILPATYHTMAVLLAPCSLCVVSLINVYKTPNLGLTVFLYFCVVASLLFILIKLPDFFSFPFYPGFAGLTFPMAIGVVASQKMGGYLTEMGYADMGYACTQLAGLQIFVTSMLVGYVLLMFLRMLLRKAPRTLQ